MPFKKFDDGSNPIDKDTEGHGFRRSLDDGSNDDAEGHGYRRSLDDGSNDDTEGHVAAQQDPGKPFARRALDDDSGDDDAEGHAAKVKI
jgi:hypothetical protein